MAGNDNFMKQIMFENALMNLSNGIANPLDREILSYTPLPENFIDPYVSQEMEARATMMLTFSSLSVWIEEAKKASYFTQHFVTLSRMINTGVSTMARGLATLHACGEDLSDAPMSIQDLIMVGSYHIRKSYLGVLQTSRSNPEIGERLLMNQFSWTNTLLRLYKTREKLSKPVVKKLTDTVKSEAIVGPDAPALESSASCEVQSSVIEALPEPSMITTQSYDMMDQLPGFSEPCAFTQPGSYGPAKAFAPFGKTAGESSDSKNSHSKSKTQTKENNETNLNDQRRENQNDRKQNIKTDENQMYNETKKEKSEEKEKEIEKKTEPGEAIKNENEEKSENNQPEKMSNNNGSVAEESSVQMDPKNNRENSDDSVIREEYGEPDPYEDEEDILSFENLLNTIYEPIPIPIKRTSGTPQNSDTT